MKIKLSNYNSQLIRWIQRKPKLSSSEIADKLKTSFPERYGDFKNDTLRRHIDSVKSVITCKSFRDIQKDIWTKIVQEYDKKYPELDARAVAKRIALKYKDRTAGTISRMVSSYRQFNDING